MINGVINVYKEPGFTSHDVVAKLRGIAGQKKIGHTGTLDPDAEGVLPVCLGKATRACDMLADRSKTYEAVLLLGIETDTQDTSGTVLEQKEVLVSEEEVRKCVASFVGLQMQTPPMYSAKKVGGRKLYDLARAGQTIERKAVPVHFYEIKILDMHLPRVTLQVKCSKGTYIRTLCHDIGQALSCGGCMEHLLRTRVGAFDLENAHRLSELQEAKDLGHLEECLIPTDQLFADLPAFRTWEDFDKALWNGNPVKSTEVRSFQDTAASPADIRMYDSKDHFIGIFTLDTLKMEWKPKKMFFDKEQLL